MRDSQPERTSSRTEHVMSCNNGLLLISFSLTHASYEFGAGHRLSRRGIPSQLCRHVKRIAKGFITVDTYAGGVGRIRLPTVQAAEGLHAPAVVHCRWPDRQRVSIGYSMLDLSDLEKVTCSYFAPSLLCLFVVAIRDCVRSKGYFQPCGNDRPERTGVAMKSEMAS